MRLHLAKGHVIFLEESCYKNPGLLVSSPILFLFSTKGTVGQVLF